VQLQVKQDEILKQKQDRKLFHLKIIYPTHRSVNRLQKEKRNNPRKASTFARHTNPDTKPTLQKSLLAIAPGHTPLFAGGHITTDEKHDRTTGSLAKYGQT
jgi:hypothetical protein